MSMAAIIPAAGTSSRLGRPKQMIPIDGKPLLGRVIQAAVDSELDRIVIVLGCQAARIQQALASLLAHPKLEVVLNPHYRRGLAGSLQAGIKPVINDYDAVMILLADHPYLTASIINRVLRSFSRSTKPLCAAAHRGRRGHPVCLHKRFFAEVMTLSGDIGARSLLRDHPDQVLEVDLDSDRYFIDIDTESDLEALKLKGYHPA